MDIVLTRSAEGAPDGATRYMRLASLLRHRIGEGHWKAGDRLPTVAGLSQHLGVARVTVRHAYQILAREGLITSGRGRGTFVEALSAEAGPRPRVSLDNPLLSDDDGIRIVVLSRDHALTLPADLAGGAPVREVYTRIRKVHLKDDRPFALHAIYVPRDIYRRFPRGSEARMRILRAVLSVGVRPTSMGQTMSVLAADDSLAHHLGCAPASPIAHLQRRILDEDGFVAFAGHAWYRGDRFRSEMDMPFELWTQYPGHAKPGAKPMGRSRRAGGNTLSP